METRVSHGLSWLVLSVCWVPSCQTHTHQLTKASFLEVTESYIRGILSKLPAGLKVPADSQLLHLRQHSPLGNTLLAILTKSKSHRWSKQHPHKYFSPYFSTLKWILDTFEKVNLSKENFQLLFLYQTLYRMRVFLRSINNNNKTTQWAG